MKYGPLLVPLIHDVEDTLSSEDKKIRELCEGSLHAFYRFGWPAMGGGREFVDGWVIGALCEHLEALYTGDIQNLLVNMPPRMGKSMLISVAYPAWIWAKSPHLRFLYTAYAQSLSVRDSTWCRRLISSPWYQNLWGDSFKLLKDSNTKLRFDNDQGGFRIASSVGGTNTGEGGDFIICDDPNSITDVESEVTRTAVNDWWSFVMSTRVTDFKSSRRLVVQQKSHQLDLSGHIKSAHAENWVHVCLPMEFEKDHRCVTIPLKSSFPKKWRDPRTKDGELLWPERLGHKELKDLKAEFKYDSYRISGQLQQRPAPSGGGILKKDWFQPYKSADLPQFEYIVQSWDTALTTNATSALSACTTWGIWTEDYTKKNVMLLSLYTGRIEYPELRKMAARLAYNYYDTEYDKPLKFKKSVDIVYVEEKVSGYSLIQDLMKANIPVTKFQPNKYGDKVARCRKVSYLIENGRVFLPTLPPHYHIFTPDSQKFLQAAMMFPNDASNDIIDSMSQAFIKMTEGDWVTSLDDPVPAPTEIWKRRPYY